MMDKPPQIDLDIAARYVVPGVVGGIVALILAAQELEDAARPWSWRYVTMAAGAGVMLGLMVKGVSEALGWPQALDAPLGGVAGAIGIRGLGVCARWLRSRLEAALSALWDRSPLAAKTPEQRKEGDDARS